LKKIFIMTVLTGMVIALVALQANASLIPMSFGFPQMTQSSSLTAFSKDTASATDSEAAAVAFPTAADTVNSAFGTSFPTISQNSVQSQLLNSVKFQNENSNFAFAYPFLSIGGSPIPSMGFL
jgi:alkaline phosphatase